MRFPQFKLPKFLRLWNENAFNYDPEDPNLHAVITISPYGGDSKIDVKNGDGKNCVALTEQLERSMGGATEKSMKPEASRVKREGGRTRVTGTDKGTKLTN